MIMFHVNLPGCKDLGWVPGSFFVELPFYLLKWQPSIIHNQPNLPKPDETT